MIEGLRRVVPILNQLEERELLADASGVRAIERATERQTESAVALSAPFEHEIPGEELWIARAAQMARARMEHDTLEARLRDPGAQALRGVHGKTHGCVEAEFVVRSDLAPQFRAGALQPGARHKALVRFSNALPGRPDRKPDARGLSIKLLDVGGYGESCVRPPLFNGMDARPEPITQDFLLVSHPTFFIKDIRDYTLFRGAADAPGKSAKLRRLALFFATRPIEAYIFVRTLLRTIDDPFEGEYHSMLASLLGPRLAVKYVVRAPWHARSANDGSPPDPKEPDFLREVMRRRLDLHSGRAVELEFSLVVPPEGRELPVEDPRVDWEAEGARRVPVASIRIAPQDFTLPSLLEARERLVFSPWHSLQDHKPLGSLSRARHMVYRTSAETRHALNAWPAALFDRPEP